MDDWRTIDSAPKDGTPLLLYVRWGGKRYRTVGRWNSHQRAWLSEIFDTPIRPTHWMPLPAPPGSDHDGSR